MNDYYETYDDPSAVADNLRVENQRLRKLVNVLEGNIAEALRMLEAERQLVRELKDYKWMYEELQ